MNDSPVNAKRVCKRCGGPLGYTNASGFCTTNPECVAERKRRKKERERVAASGMRGVQGRRNTSAEDAGKRLAGAYQVRAELVADRARRGVPDDGHPPWWLDDLFARPWIN